MTTTYNDIFKPNFLVKVALKDGSVIGARVQNKHFDNGWLVELGVKTDDHNFSETFPIDQILKSIDSNIPLEVSN